MAVTEMVPQIPKQYQRKKYYIDLTYFKVNISSQQILLVSRARSSVVGWGTVLQDGVLGSILDEDTRFFNWLNFSAEPCPCSSLSLQQKGVPGIFLVVKCGWPASMADKLTATYKLSRKYGNLDVSKSSAAYYRDCLTFAFLRHFHSFNEDCAVIDRVRIPLSGLEGNRNVKVLHGFKSCRVYKVH
jgi:hypothetical protein